MRLASPKKATNKWADFPTQLTEDRTTEGRILTIPRVTSENSSIEYIDPPTICSDSTFQVVDADSYLLAILNSSMHMAWLSTIFGCLKGDYRYSNTIVYNNFIFPTPTGNQKSAIEKCARNILELREKHTQSTLTDLYEPLVTLPDLLKSHRDLDRAVEMAYGKTFTSDEGRVAHLFKKY